MACIVVRKDIVEVGLKLDLKEFVKLEWFSDIGILIVPLELGEVDRLSLCYLK